MQSYRLRNLFLNKIRESNLTLKKFYSKLQEDSSLLLAYRWIRRLGMRRIAAWLFMHCKKGLESNLLSSNPSLNGLKAYKLLHLSSLMNEE